MGPETKNDCAGEDQQQFTGLDWVKYLSVCLENRIYQNLELGILF
jgi:hypothetical protein